MDSSQNNQKSKSFSHQNRNHSTSNSHRSKNGKRKPSRKVLGVRSSTYQRGPVLEYVSACCALPARKPPTGKKSVQEDPESHKMKEVAKGLGKWRCSNCGKRCTVRPQARKVETPAPAVVVVIAEPTPVVQQ
jgi:hypothetical protein